MQKIDKGLEVLPNVQVSKFEWSGKIRSNVEKYLFSSDFLLLCVGFLLGRAIILNQLSPFALPFFAAVLMMKREKSGWAALAVIIGSLSQTWMHSVYITASFLMFFIFHAIITRFSYDVLKSVPITVLLASISARLGYTYAVAGAITNYDYMMAAVEAGLGLILTMIFIQGVPLLSPQKRNKALKHEEMVCLMILCASVLTGTIGWSIYDLSIEHIFSRYLVVVFAFAGGAAIGSTVGVVIGLILSLADVSSLYQMSLLAFSGLLGGLLKDGGKLGVSSGLLVGTLLIGLYGENFYAFMPTILETMVSFTLFLFTPHYLFTQVERYIPGTEEYRKEQQQYLRKIRDSTANRVEQFSTLFHTLSNSFQQQGLIQEEKDEMKEIDYFLSDVTEKTCQSCFRKSSCWNDNFEKTYDYMLQIMQETESNGGRISNNLEYSWEKHCKNSKKVVDTIYQQLSYYQANKKLKQQVKESRRLVAEQLLGVSQVMGDFAKEIQKERANLQVQEEEILSSLEKMGIEIGHVEIFGLNKGNIDIEMSIPYCNGSGECEKVIAPMLSDIMDETIVVKKEECASYPNGYCHVSFTSAKAFVVDTGVATAAKGGAFVSGDSYSVVEIGSGKYALAISDGMGNGERAHIESNETLKLLQKILQSGIDEHVAIKSINSVLSLRTTDEIFSTLDLAMIDLQDAQAKFLKIGSSPSFIKRGGKVKKVEAGNLPIGIIEDVEVDVVNEQLKAGDLLIMMSDGIFEGPRDVENYDVWMKRKIREIETKNPQEVADLILEEVVRTSGQIIDDMTVVVARIEHNTPKWAPIPTYYGKAL
ncbi:stage II sporulation protein E [Bacillus solimangrovi]|uniref:Stage II sporulation protein E n=1 Tax=Bacillus solimangrovi TaxID=1305675 RepID=A0A1E5LF13_9BACI|nr:stage II sporulation protein E [Bacillus solimangrovi]OEH92659.1 stage II sporulation protein E [Bacillus solimangrovi]